MEKIAGWIITNEAAEKWIRLHPECADLPLPPPGCKMPVWAFLPEFVERRLGTKFGRGRVMLTVWPKARICPGPRPFLEHCPGFTFEFSVTSAFVRGHSYCLRSAVVLLYSSSKLSRPSARRRGTTSRRSP